MNSKTVSWAGHVALMDKMRIAYKNLVIKVEGKKRSLWRRRHRYEKHDIEIDLKQ
jgi:hypothetical protein